MIYIEGVALMVLRRLLEGTIDIAQADTILQLAWRGLGITPVRIPALIQLSRCFIESLGL
ncbi:MAG: hypothetical protein IPK95_12785 [Cellvibrionales bacterium]|nr:hypothetical protein [Cellvibrionales bacterium]